MSLSVAWEIMRHQVELTQTTTVQVGEGLLHIFVLNLFFSFLFFFCNHHIDDSMDRYSYFIITHLIISLPNAISFQKLLAQQLGPPTEYL